MSTAKNALEAHCRALADCRRCGYGTGVVPIVSRATRPRAMIVGQAPGKVEAAGGKPFAGRAGRTLFRWLERAGIDEDTARARIYIAAVTRCYPGPSPSGRGDRVPSPNEQQACASWLTDELRIIRPRLIIPVGRLAITRFLANRPLEDLIGQTHEVEHAGRGATVIPLPHPSGASSWIHEADHPTLLGAALRMIGEKLRELGVVPSSHTRSVA
jgi:uracil-DNA glycosylase